MTGIYIIAGGVFFLMIGAVVGLAIGVAKLSRRVREMRHDVNLCVDGLDMLGGFLDDHADRLRTAESRVNHLARKAGR